MTYDPMAGAADMVERVAIAISLADDDGQRAETMASYYRGLARSAIAAMREPTATMVRDGMISIETRRPGTGSKREQAEACWKSMIDAIEQK